jgi:hypothetical protein
MQRKVQTITTYVISLLLMSTVLLFSEAALSKRHSKHHASHSHKKTHHTVVAHKKSHHHIKLAHAKTTHHTTIHATKVQLPVIRQAENDTVMNMNPRVWDLALKAYNKAKQRGFIKQKVLTVIDYSLPSSVKRMWVVDVTERKVLYHTLVAHGKYTGDLLAKHFSDKPGSRASSIGLFVTDKTYIGSKGYSLRLRGLENGFNDKALSRAIVVHGAWYATADFAAQHGRLGLSWGCPAVSPTLVRPIINEIKGGTLVFAYYPDSHWLKTSQFLI